MNYEEVSKLLRESNASLETRDVQALSIMLMMYRQGWLDAAEHLSAETMRQSRTMRVKCEELKAAAV